MGRQAAFATRAGILGGSGAWQACLASSRGKFLYLTHIYSREGMNPRTERHSSRRVGSPFGFAKNLRGALPAAGRAPPALRQLAPMMRSEPATTRFEAAA